MAIFNSYVKLPEGKTKINHTQIHHKWVVQTIKKIKWFIIVWTTLYAKNNQHIFYVPKTNIERRLLIHV